MCKKLIVLASVVLTLGFVNVGDAADILWTGAGADNLWENGANWEGNKAPGAADWAHIESPGATAPNGPVIQDGMHIEIDGMSNELPGEPTLTITGGTLILTGWGIWWGDAGDCVATCYMSGGTMELTGGPGIHEFGWGGASGKWIMTGGTVNAQGVVLSTGPGNTGELYLHGGTYNIGTSRAANSDRFGGGLLVNDGGLIDITEGTLIMEVLEGEEGRFMQYIEDLMAAGQITAHGGAGVFAMDFDGRNPGKVTLTAVEAGKAYNPDPADGSVYEDTWASLSWSAAAGAVSHDVYVGEDFDQVSDGTGDTFRGNQGDTFYIVGFPGYPYPDGLVAGTTYYWRIDEVEADGTTNRGDVWSFTVPPKTAFNPDPADGAESVALDAELSWNPGFGAMLHTVYFGDNFDDVSNAAGGDSQGPATYSPGPLEREKVYYWRVDEFDAVETHKGDVWAFSTPGAVGNPSPANGVTGVQMNATLSWTAAESATSSEVYFGTDKDAVRNATSASPEYKGSRAVGSESYEPGKLAWKSTYYWRVDGVSAAGSVKGIVWSFETADFITVDDFESYTETEPDLIWNSWIDFFVNKTGVIVGYADPPSTEVDIVHGGSQAMPLSYENDGTVLDGTQFETKDTAFYAETQHEWTAPQDWTADGVEVLSLWFHGNSSNDPEPMYVVLNGTAVVHHDDPAAVQIGEWTEWTINLREFSSQGVDLTNVNSIGIGFGDKNNVQAGGSGWMLFDDVALYRPDVTPVVGTLTGLADVTVADDAIVSFRCEGTEYVVADGDLMLGTTTRWYIDPVTGAETLWADGDPAPAATVSGTSNPKSGDVGSNADNFFFSIPGDADNISSIDGIDFQQTVFPSLSDTFFVFERGGNDAGTFQAILADGSLGEPVEFAKSGDGGPYASTGVANGTQTAFGVVFKTNVPVMGVRITSSGHDTLSISAIAAP